MSMVYCRGCGKQIHESATSCPQCGATQPGATKPMVMTATLMDVSELPKALAAAAPASAGPVDGRARVSAKWQRRFELIERAGGPKLPNSKVLSMSERVLVGCSFVAGFFGLFWYLAKGMWRKAITVTLLVMVATVALELLLQAVFGAAPVGVLVGLGFAIYGTRGIKDYYKAVVLGERSWW